MEELIFFRDQDEFCKWLKNNYSTQKIVWVGYYKKNTNIPSMTWSDSVDVALCYGWIDGIRKSIDEQRYKIRFTPRNKKSVWSSLNISKVNLLIKQGKMKPEGLYLYNNRIDKVGYSSQQRVIQLSKEYENQIKSNEVAWSFFTELSPSCKRDSIWWIMSAKKEQTRQKRVAILIESSHQGLKIPMLRNRKKL